jgi:hypothetical protein
MSPLVAADWHTGGLGAGPLHELGGRRGAGCIAVTGSFGSQSVPLPFHNLAKRFNSPS